MAETDKTGADDGSFFPTAFSIVLFYTLVGLAVAIAIFGFTFGFLFTEGRIFAEYYNLAWNIFLFSSITGLLFIVAGVYHLFFIVKIRGEELREYEENRLTSQVGPNRFERRIQERWERVILFTEEESKNGWRAGVIEADILLEDILEKEGVAGENLGTKLKSVTKGDLSSIDDLWRAHKYRNKIVHTVQEIRKEEVLDAINGFKKAFVELGYIKG